MPKKVTYWICDAPSCKRKHRSEKAAKQCPSARLHRPFSAILSESIDRKKRVLEWRKKGMKYREIAERLGVSISRARELHKDAERLNGRNLLDAEKLMELRNYNKSKMFDPKEHSRLLALAWLEEQGYYKDGNRVRQTNPEARTDDREI